MKTNRILIFAMSALVLGACNKAYKVEDPEFDVSAPVVARVGEKVIFSLSGATDVMSFYSGENGHEYELGQKDQIVPCSEMFLSFKTSTNKSNPSSSKPNPKTIPISYSTDFSGDYSRHYMDEATWIDISDRFTMATKRDQKNIDSGKANMDDIFADPSKPVYFRLEYSAAPSVPKNSNQRTQWTFSAMNFTTPINGKDRVVWDIYDMGWQVIKGEGFETIPEDRLPQYPMLTGSEKIMFNSQPDPEQDITYWMVSGPVLRKETINLGHDYPIAIKALADPQLQTYEYTYSEPGTYTATFVGTNVNLDGRRTLARSVTVEVIKDGGSIGGFEPGEWK